MNLRAVSLFTCACLNQNLWASTPNMEELAVLSLEQLLNVQVSTASRFDESLWQAPGILSLLTAEDIQRSGATDLGKLLEKVTSSYFFSSYVFPNSVLSMRGDYSAHHEFHVLTLINGRPISGVYASSLYNAFPLGNVKQIEVVRGPGSVLYGSTAYSGVINIVTQPGTQTENRVRLVTGSHNSQGVEASFAVNRQGLNISSALTAHSDDGWRYRVTDELGQYDELNYQDESFGFHSTFDAGNFTAQALLTKNRQFIFGAVPQLPKACDNLGEFMGGGCNGFGRNHDLDMQHHLLSAGYRWQGSDRWNSDIHLSFDYTELFADYLLGNTFATDALQSRLEFNSRYQYSDQLRFSFGVEAVDDKSRSSTVGGIVDIVPPYSQNTHFYRGYGEGHYQLSHRTSVTLGGQINKPSTNKSHSVVRAGLIHHFDDHWGMKILNGDAYRAPATGELYANVPGAVIGNPDLQPELVNTTDLQVFFHNEDLHSALTLYRSVQQGLITRVPSGNGNETVYANFGERTFKGLEAELKWQLADSLRLEFFGTVQRSEQNGIEQITLLPEQLVKLGINYQLSPTLNLDIFDLYAGNWGKVQDIKATTTVNPDPRSHHHVNVHLLWQSSQHLSLSARITNLLDEDIYYPELSRGIINSIPGRDDRAVYLAANYQF